MEGGSPPMGPRTRREEEEFARLFKPNPQTHSQRLADPWPITNSITGAGTPWYVPPRSKGTTTTKDAGESSRVIQEQAKEQAAAHQSSQADHHHYTAAPIQYPYFVAPKNPGLRPAMTAAEEIFAARFGIKLPKGIFGAPHDMYNKSGYGTDRMDHGPPNTAAMAHGYPANATYQLRPDMYPQQNAPAHGMQYNIPGTMPAQTAPGEAPPPNVHLNAHQIRLRQTLGSRAGFRFPAAEPAMRSGSPPSSASIDDGLAESEQKAAGSAHPFSTPVAAEKGGNCHSKASAESGSSGKRHGLGYGLWPLRGLSPFGGSPPKFSSSRGQIGASVRERSPETGGVPLAAGSGQLLILVDVALESISRAYSFDEKESKEVLSRALEQSSSIICGNSPNALDDPAKAGSMGRNPQSTALMEQLQLQWTEFIPLLHENARLMQITKDLEKETVKNAQKWQNDLRQMADAFYKIYVQGEQLNERETFLQKREAAMNKAHREVQQRLAELDFERAAVIRRSAEKDKEVKNTREQFQRLRERIVALQTQVTMQQQQRVQLMGQMATLQQQNSFMHAPFAQTVQPGFQHGAFMPGLFPQPTQPGYLQQGFIGGEFAQQPPLHSGYQNQPFSNHGPAQQDTQYSGYHDTDDPFGYELPLAYYLGDEQGIISGPPYEERIPEFEKPPPPTPTPLPGRNWMAAWDSDQLHNMRQAPGSFFSPSESCHSQAPTLVGEINASPKLDTQRPTDRAFYTLDDEQSVPVTPSYKITRLAPTPPLHASDMSSPITVQRPAEHNIIGLNSKSNPRTAFHVVPHPADDAFVPLTQSPPGPKTAWLKPSDYYSMSYTSLLNACFSKVEGAIRLMTIAPIIEKACAGDPAALDFVQKCKEHLINHQEAWTMLGDESLKLYLVIGVVQRHLIEYAIFDGILTKFECGQQAEFIHRFKKDVESVNEKYNRIYYALNRAKVATTISRHPQFADWFVSYSEQTAIRIIDAIKPAFQPSQLQWLLDALRPAVHEGLCIGLRMLKDPRCFEFCFPKLGTVWDNRFNVHRNPELVGQVLPNENPPYVVHCSLRPIVTVTDFEKDYSATILTAHRAEVLVADSKLQEFKTDGPEEEKIPTRLSNPRCRAQGN